MDSLLLIAMGNYDIRTDEEVPGWMFEREDDEVLQFIVKN